MSKKQINAITVLKKAEEILQRPNKKGFGWAKGTLARNLHGETSVDAKGACKFCAIGAVERAGLELGLEVGFSWAPVREAKQRLDRVMTDSAGFYGVADANDDPRTTFPQVLNAFTLAQTSAGDK